MRFLCPGGRRWRSANLRAATFKLRLMEQINRIEIRGNVGAVRLLVVGNSRVAKISVATNYVYKGRDGYPVIETTCYSNR